MEFTINEEFRMTCKSAHEAIAELEEHFDVTVVTQNIDTIHERTGQKMLHLHGKITDNTIDQSLVYELKGLDKYGL